MVSRERHLERLVHSIRHRGSWKEASRLYSIYPAPGPCKDYRMLKEMG